MITKTYEVSLNGRAVEVSDIDLSDGVAATLSVDGKTVRLSLDQASARESFAATTGIDISDIERLRQWALTLGAPDGAGPSQPMTLPAVDPFPLEVLPPIVRDYCEAAAHSLGNDIPIEMVACPLLALAGSLAGNRIGIAIKGDDWVEYGGLWIAIVARPGSAKTAAIAKARRPLARLQVNAKERFDLALAEYRQEHTTWSRDKASGVEPERPKMGHYYTSDVTVERLAEMLGQNPGLAVIVDELRGWVGGFDRYRSGGKGSDRQQYMSIWSSDPIKVDRKSGTGDPIYVRRPVASVVGGLQVDFAGDFRHAHGADGFAERVLPLVFDHGSQNWTDAAISAKQSDELFALFAQIDTLAPLTKGEDGLTVQLHPEARQLWIDFYNENAKRVNAATGLAGGMLQKLSSYTARLALILHLLWHADDPRVLIDATTMAAAIELSTWWRQHIARYLCLLNSSASSESVDPVSRRILRILRTPLITDDGGWVTRTDVYNRLRTVRSEELDGALTFLQAAGRIEQRTDVSTTKRGTSWRIAPKSGSEDSYFSENPARNGAHAPNTPNNQNPQNGVHAHEDDERVMLWQARPPTEPDDLDSDSPESATSNGRQHLRI